MKGLMYLVAALIFLIIIFAGISTALSHPTLVNIGFEVVFIGFFALALWLYIRVNREPSPENEQ